MPPTEGGGMGISMKEIQKYLDQMNLVFEKRMEEYTYENCEGESISCSDYLNDSIPAERVYSDAKKLIDILYNAQNNLSDEEFLVVLAAYCNYYIEEGFMLKINQEYWGLNDFFTTKDEKDIHYLICDGVIRQDYSNFEKVIKIDNKCIVANVYLFVKSMAETLYSISMDRTDVDEVENKAWNYYENLNDTWKKYVIQQKEEYPSKDKSPIPYIYCRKRETSHFEDMLIGYTKSIIETLKIESYEPNNLYNLIQEKYHVMSAAKPLYDISSKYKDMTIDFSESLNRPLNEHEKKFSNEVNQALFNTVIEYMKGFENRDKTYYDMMFLFEKLGYLVQMTDEDRKMQHKFEIWNFPDENYSLLERYEYVHIPVITCESISMKQLVDRYRLFSLNKELRKKNDELNRLNTELSNKIDTITTMNIQRAKMVDQLEHSWGNESYPEIVKEVADSLNKQQKTDLANKLFMAYESESMMMGQIIILQALMSDNLGELKQIFKDSFFVSGEEKIGYKVEEILQENMYRLISMLLYAKETKNKKKQICREKLFSKNSSSVIEKSFEIFKFHDVENNVFNWFNDNVFDMKLSIDKEWRNINFGLTQNGRIIFENIFTELFTNILFHGKNFCEIKLFYEDECYKIEIRNGIDSDNQGGRKGLNAMEALMDRLNYKTNVPAGKGLVFHEIDDKCFLTTISFAKELMYLEGLVS